ncbi:response regulator [Paenibacillaceae bacterium WGS1546]|uniref:response regulator transcription factor n=1 Tax=Cohnella sp. WGS1546 TaxID=3366810 RepID=UPI00372D1F04
MRKVMVVDDEKWVRRGLIQSIPWERLGLQLAGEAADGQDAYEMALEHKPDLLFLDMRMPGLDGKELLALLDAELPELLTIVVSGYSDFEYTKQAIRHRAFDYLLKPVKKEELADVLDKAVKELDRREEERLKTAEVRQSDGWFRDLLLERAEAPDSWAGLSAAVFVAQADRYGEDGGDAGRLRSLREKLDRERAFYFGGEWGLALSPAPDGGPETVGAVAARSLPSGELNRLLAAVQAELKRLDGVGRSIGVSEEGSAEANRLRRAFSQAQAALAGRRLGAKEALLFAGSSEVAAPAAEPYPQKREQAFLLALQMGSREEAWREFDLLMASVCGESATVDRMQQGAILLVHALERQLRANDSSLEIVCGKHSLELTEALRRRVDPDSVRALFADEIIPAALAAAERQGATQGERIVREVLKLIETHFDQPLSLQHIAESRFVNPDYLSRLFKKTTGHSFVDYLTNTRIRKAMELMRVPAYKNYEIARKVGYEDYRYFSQIFKKKTGKTIGDFRSEFVSGKT